MRRVVGGWKEGEGVEEPWLQVQWWLRICPTWASRATQSSARRLIWYSQVMSSTGFKMFSYNAPTLHHRMQAA